MALHSDLIPYTLHSISFERQMNTDITRHGTDVTLWEIHMVSSIPIQITLSIDLNFTPNHVATVKAHFKRQSDGSPIPSKVLVQHNYAIFLTVISSCVSGPTFS